MTSPVNPAAGWEPRRPALLAFAVFLAAGLVLFWPILTGQFMAGPDSDQYVAGYGFRLFGADYFRQFGRIPLWNPYLFGGLPFVAAMHGDVFYPTAWLRWILPTDTAMNLGFAAHIVIAGCTMYALLRALRVGWAGAVAGGISYELSGIVAGLVNPGHDGKLFVSALAPLLLLAVLRAVRDGRRSAFGVMALTVGLVLHGHPQLSYYLLVATALWGLWLLFLAPERPDRARLPLIVAGSALAVLLGFGLYAIQALPFIQYIPFSPRGAGGPSGGWEYATAYALPPSEIISAILPEFNGLKAAYWGVNPLKHHTEYLGLLPVVLATFGIRDRSRRPWVLALGAIGALFLLIALGGHTPFYRLWYEVMPMMKKVRAPGMAWFLVALPVSVFAGFGVDQLLAGKVSLRRVILTVGGFAVLALLGLVGALQAVAEAIALPERMEGAMRNAGALQLGSGRLLMLAIAGGGVLAACARGRLAGRAAAAALGAMLVVDLWSVDRQFFVFQPPAAITYRDDAIITRLRTTTLPYRTLDVGIYPGSWLMAHQVPTMLGYHGNELRWYDELLGGKNEWRNLGNPTIWDLLAVRYLITGQAIQAPGWHQVLGPVPTTPGAQAWLYEADSVPAYARVLPAAAKVPEVQLIPTLLNPRFPVNRVVLYPDTVAITPAPIGDAMPTPAPVTAQVSAWAPGRISVRLAGAATSQTYLVVSENWYPDWAATVDGTPVPTLRAQYSLLSVPLPPGAKEVTFEMRSPAYERGRLITLVSLAGALLLLLVPLVRRRTDA